MSTGLLIAAALLVAIVCAHSYLGERYILLRLFRRADLPRPFGSDWFTRRTLWFAWHITSASCSPSACDSWPGWRGRRRGPSL